jgi:hypothetical protein
VWPSRPRCGIPSDALTARDPRFPPGVTVERQAEARPRRNGDQIVPPSQRWTRSPCGGVKIIPLLLGAGLAGAALIATDAAISLTLHVARSFAYQRFDLLDGELFAFGLVLGVATIPGSWIAAKVEVYAVALELLVTAVALWIGVSSILRHLE